MKYFVVNKRMDYERGFLSGAVCGEAGLSLSPNADYGVFFSRVFDCREEETKWHRCSVFGKSPGAAAAVFTFYVSEQPEILVDGRRRMLSEFLRDDGISLSEKKDRIKHLEKKTAAGIGDFLLSEVQGRYVFFLAELYRQGGETPVISGMELSFPREDWLSYLPGVYGKKEAGADFTSRFLGVFQSFYDDCERRIRESSRLLDPAEQSYEGLKKLAGWFHFEDLYIWPEDRLREFLKQAPELMKETGTVRGMIRLIRLYTGEDPLLVECQSTGGTYRPEKFARPYGENPYEFVLLVKETYISTARDYQAMLCLIGQMKPAYMRVRLIPLRPRLTLGAYSYLGVNSVIGSVSPLRLDGRSSLMFSAVGGGTIEGGAGA